MYTLLPVPVGPTYNSSSMSRMQECGCVYAVCAVCVCVCMCDDNSVCMSVLCAYVRACAVITCHNMQHLTVQYVTCSSLQCNM